jgi:hypothetical protein
MIEQVLDGSYVTIERCTSKSVVSSRIGLVNVIPRTEHFLDQINPPTFCGTN